MTKLNLSVIALTAALASPAAFAQVAMEPESETAAQVRETGNDIADGAADMTDRAGDALENGADRVEQEWDEMTAPDADDMSSTGIAPMTSTGVDPTDTTNTDMSQPEVAAMPATAMNAMLGSDILNKTIYFSESNTVATTDEIPADWERVAEITDLLISPEGQVIGYVADVGGFLGLATRSVALDINAVTPVVIDGEGVYTVNLTKAEMESLPELDAM